MRILLVDDDQATLDVLDFTLTLDGHLTRKVTNGADALVAASEFRPHLIVLDGMMPVMDGIATAQHIRADESLGRTPILMLTAKVLDAHQWAGWQAGVDSYVTKPLDITVLRQEMDRICTAEVSA